MIANYDIVKDRDKGFQNGLLHADDNAAIITEISNRTEQISRVTNVSDLTACNIKHNIITRSDNICTGVPEAHFENEVWSIERLVDEFFLDLYNVKIRDEKDGLIKRKYEEHAKWLMYRIPLYRPAPAFIINLSDLSTRIKKELTNLDDKTLDYVLKEGISRIFEGIDQRYYRLSSRPFLKWEIRK
jgi:hypothetical protein